MTAITDIKNGIIAQLVTILPAEYQELAYVEEPENNSWSQITKGYGVRVLEGNEVSGVNKVYTMTQVFEVIQAERFLQSQIGDEKLRDISYDLRENCLDIYKDMVNTKAGTPASVMNVTNLFMSEPEIDVEAKVVYQRMEFTILYRVSLI